ncbi:MAG: D-alanyl-D-alanine carboxypeptidase [Clostridia bacterium]|nr:D-alanyl-D-alanine carboxypeptidase [Clostridia bacterium]
MKKIVAVLGALCVLTGCRSALAVSAETDNLSLVKECKAAYLMDFNSGECIYSYNECDRMPIASVCKVMTLTLCFDAVEQGKIALEEEVTVSSRAAGMGGSQIFLESGYSYPLTELVKSIVVCSANDSCVAVAERISGSEEQFVADMNEKAAELGCKDTLFSNCTGLPKETQYSCAKDVAVMFANLINHKEYFNYSKIWLEDFSHGNGRTTSMTNTNKLIRRYNACDGGKTGFTGEAGYCLASTAYKDNMRLVSSVLGASTSENRFSSAVSMFDYGFSNYKNKIILDKSVTLNDEFKLLGGKKKSYAVFPERDAFIFCKKGEEREVKYIITDNKVKAPVAKGQTVGKIEIYCGDVLHDTVNVVAAESVARASFGDVIKRIGENWAL